RPGAPPRPPPGRPPPLPPPPPPPAGGVLSPPPRAPAGSRPGVASGRCAARVAARRSTCSTVTDAHGDSRGDRETTIGVAAVTAGTRRAGSTGSCTRGGRAGVATGTRCNRAALTAVGHTTLATGRATT